MLHPHRTILTASFCSALAAFAANPPFKVGDRVNASVDGFASGKILYGCTVVDMAQWSMTGIIAGYRVRCPVGGKTEDLVVSPEAEHVRPASSQPARTDAATLTRAQGGNADLFGARAPRTCASMKAPVQGPPSGTQAAQYFICAQERTALSPTLTLFLLEDVNVEVGTGRPYSPVADGLAVDIDTRQPVYPIRGSYTSIICRAQSSGAAGTRFTGNIGHNCSTFDVPRAEGKCHKTAFGDWNCGMTGDLTNQRENQPPPR
jgi:hypothetical protein